MLARYKNPWHKPFAQFTNGPEFFETDKSPKEYGGFLIYERIPGKCRDVVKDGECVAQRAGMTGAKQAIDQINNNKQGE